VARSLLAFALLRAPLALGAVACASSSPAAPTPDPTSGPPHLTALSVSTPSGASLVPTFSPSIHDYYVQCASGTNTWTLSIAAPSGTTVSLAKPTGAPASQPVAVAENEAVVIAATDGESTTEYWIRCLPHDFPPMLWTPHTEAGLPPPGYYIVGNWWIPTSGLIGGYAIVLDGNGVPVWYLRMPGTLGVANVDSLAPDSVAYFPYPVGGAFDTRVLTPLMTTTVVPAGQEASNHELRLLPSGDYLAFTTPLTYGVNLSRFRSSDTVIQDCEVVEFTPNGTPVWTWLASDHFDPAEASTFPQPGGTAPNGAGVLDVFHCNSIDVDPANGNLLVSGRNMDSIFYIERPSGRVLWKMGGATSSKDNAAYVSVADPFFRQHDARLQPGWSWTSGGGRGQVSVFDDETEKPGPARAVVYDVVVGAPSSGADGGGALEGGTTSGTATVDWEYEGLSSSAYAGTFRVYPDGSRVIGWGVSLTAQLVFAEVDVHGNDLLDFGFADSEPSYRAIKVPLDTFDPDVLRQTSGLP
jgi:hypothetical protein